MRFFNGDIITTERVDVPKYSWADPAYALVHSSIVECHRNLLGGLTGEWKAETTCRDNVRTLGLVYAAYESAEEAKSVQINHAIEFKDS